MSHSNLEETDIITSLAMWSRFQFVMFSNTKRRPRKTDLSNYLKRLLAISHPVFVQSAKVRSVTSTFHDSTVMCCIKIQSVQPKF